MRALLVLPQPSVGFHTPEREFFPPPWTARQGPNGKPISLRAFPAAPLAYRLPKERGMRTSGWAGLTLAFAAFAVSAAVVAQTSNTPRFRSGVDLVALDVCVTDRNGRFLPALNANDFFVFEDRVPQRVTFFSAEGKLALTAVVLIDRSSSMTGAKLERAKTAAVTFLRHLGPEDLGTVMAFNRSAERIVPFGTNVTAATPLIDQIRAGGATALFDAMLVALHELQTARQSGEIPRREALVVLSDGEDTGSRLAFEDVHEEAQRAGVVVYSISIRMDEHDRGLPPLHEFAQLANDSGGRVVAVKDLTTLDAVYAEIAAELRHMYRLAYMPTAPTHDGRWHSVAVRVLDREARVRTRAGYFAPASTPRVGRQP